MPTRWPAKIVLALVALAPAAFLFAMFGLQFFAPNLDFTPLARAFIWVVPFSILMAIYFAWIASRANLSVSQRVGWVIALLLWFPLAGIVFWIAVIRKIRSVPNAT